METNQLKLPTHPLLKALEKDIFKFGAAFSKGLNIQTPPPYKISPPVYKPVNITQGSGFAPASERLPVQPINNTVTPTTPLSPQPVVEATTPPKVYGFDNNFFAGYNDANTNQYNMSNDYGNFSDELNNFLSNMNK
jgi:hypothetical protein